MSATLFDMHFVVDGFSDDGLGISTHPGNFFEAKSIPTEKNLYILKFVLHNHDDENAITILKNILHAMPQQGKLCVVEQPLLDEKDCQHMNISMMILNGAKERTLA